MSKRKGLLTGLLVAAGLYNAGNAAAYTAELDDATVEALIATVGDQEVRAAMHAVVAINDSDMREKGKPKK